MRFRLGTTGGQEMADGFGRALNNVFMAPIYGAQGAEEAQQAKAKGDLMAAQTALYGQKAEAERQQLERGSLPELIASAALTHGVPLHQVPEVSNYFQTGQLAGQYTTPADGVGPTMPTPDYANSAGLGGQIMRTLGLTRGALTVGDKSIENVAKAGGELQDQGIARAAADAAARGDDMTMSRLNTVRGKKEFTPFKAVSNTGTAINEVTGQQDVSNPGMRALFGNVQRSAAAENFAQADAARALEQQRKDEIGRGKAGEVVQVTRPDGSVWLVNKLTGQARPVVDSEGNAITTAPGSNAGKSSSTGPSGKPMTEAQAKANLFGGRMTESDAILNELEDKGVYRPGNIKSLATGVAEAVPLIGDSLAEGASAATNWTQSTAQQRVEQARRDFVNAVLRRESGAVISDAEFSNAEKQYFPAPGDSPEVRAQKRRNRQIATTLMLQEVPEAQRYKRGQVPMEPAAPPVPQAGGAAGSWSDPADGWSIKRVN